MEPPERPQRADAFDLLRLIASLMVLWSHQHVLLGFPEPAVPAVAGSIGTLGVCIFFAISGYLNVQSAFRRRAAGSFLLARALRIYPALIVCVAFCVLLGAAITSDPQRFYGLKTLKFLVQNATLVGIEVRLPGVFETNIYRDAVNGSLWTLPMEAACYLGLAAIAFCANFKPARLLILLLVLSVVLWLFSAFIRDIESDWLMKLDHFPRFYGAVFLGGALLAASEKVFGPWPAVGVVAAVALAFALTGQTMTATLVALPIAFVSIGRLTTVTWLRPKIDISYGAYLYAFPIQQFIAGYRLSFWTSLALSLGLTLVLGFLSAILIERPALKWHQNRRASTVAVPVPN
jgi:peptidoglycan/LPS O-acetylase OafA/YrhL